MGAFSFFPGDMGTASVRARSIRVIGIDLGTTNSTVAEVILCTLKSGRQLRLQSPSLSTQQFEQLLEPFLDRDFLYARDTEYRMTCSIFAPIEDALTRAGLAADEVDCCLLVGGSALIPQVGDAIEAAFPGARLLQFPDATSTQTAVARGAAYRFVT